MNPQITGVVLVTLALPAASMPVQSYCWSDDDCSAAEYCLFEPCAVETGMCTPRPASCLPYYDPVCGCDGLTYGSACLAAMAGISVDHPAICGQACPCDLNSDGVVDAADLADLLAAWGDNPQHPADLDASGGVDAADLAILLGDWGDCGPVVTEQGHSGCLPRRRGDYPWCEPDVVNFLVEGTTIVIQHLGATYNCCPDDIVMSLTVEGQLLHVFEQEILTMPCDCMCCYNTHGTVANLIPGETYIVEFCWQDYEQGYRCVEQEVIIPTE